MRYQQSVAFFRNKEIRRVEAAAERWKLPAGLLIPSLGITRLQRTMICCDANMGSVDE
jgi:hypothetical protein